MKTQIIVLQVIAAAVAVTGMSSCSLLHNKNDWAMGKGSSPRYVPQQIGKPETGLAVRGGN
jgi:hypothetical protein